MDSKRFNIIESERIILRRFKESDAESFFSYRPKPEVSLYQSEGWDNYTMNQAIKFVNEQMLNDIGVPDTWFQIAIELKQTGSLIGDCGVHTLAYDTNQVEIGFTLDPSYQNYGFGAEAVKCLLDYIFRVLERHRVIAITDTRNTKSIKLLEKIGMRKEGHFIKNAMYRGEYVDEFLYAILKEEWH